MKQPYRSRAVIVPIQRKTLLVVEHHGHEEHE